MEEVIKENLEKLKEKEIIYLIYQSQSEKIEKLIINVNRAVKDELKPINTEKVLAHSINPQELKEVFNKIEDNYNIKISRYNKEMYKQGFIDGVNLMLNCLK